MSFMKTGEWWTYGGDGSVWELKTNGFAEVVRDGDVYKRGYVHTKPDRFERTEGWELSKSGSTPSVVTAPIPPPLPPRPTCRRCEQRPQAENDYICEECRWGT